MSSYNRVILMGNITRDIEVRTLPSQSSVAQLGIAVNRKWKDAASGEMREEVTFVDCECFGKTAENIARFFSKGKPILIEGRLKLDTWKDKSDGSNRSKLKVIVESFEFVGGKDDAAQPAAPPARGRPVAAAQTGYEPIAEDDIPFSPTHGIV